MAYQNVNFPTLKLIHGFREERDAPVTVISNFAKEYRISRFSQSKARFIFPGRTLRAADWTTIKSFLDGVKWKTDSFNLIHPTTGVSIKVRLDSIPSMEITSLNSSNQPVTVAITDIALVQVFNE